MLGSEEMAVLCAGCERPIMDRFLLTVLDRAWHARCVQCVDCQGMLSDKCFSRDGRLFCRQDFYRRYGTKCGGCSQGISPNDLVRRARDQVFHLKCFTCMVCRKQLSTGEELYVLDENKFICKHDYLATRLQGSEDDEEGDMELDQVISDRCEDSASEKDAQLVTSRNPLDTHDTILKATLSPSNGLSGMLPAGLPVPAPGGGAVLALPGDAGVIKEEPDSGAESDGDLDNADDACSTHTTDSKAPGSEGNKGTDLNKENTGSEETETQSGKGSKKRGPRTTIKAKQLETLKAAFAATPKPTRHIREQLAKETGLPMRVIQVWFQNKRSKERRMKQLSALGARRQFFRGPRRLRALDDNPDLLGQPPFYFPDHQDYYPGYPPYADYFPGGQDPGAPPGINFLPPSSLAQGSQPMQEHPLPGQVPTMDSHFLGQHPGDMGAYPPSPSPDHQLPPNMAPMMSLDKLPYTSSSAHHLPELSQLQALSHASHPLPPVDR